MAYREGQANEKGSSALSAVSLPVKTSWLSWFTRNLSVLHYGLVGVVLALASFRLLVTDAGDPYKCNALLNDGQWLDEGLSHNNSLANWQPDGCMMQSYTTEAANACFEGRTIFFIGDSIVRRLFIQAVKTMDPEFDTDSMWSKAKGNRHRNGVHEANGVLSQYIFDPFLNTSRTRGILQGTDASQQDGNKPALIVFHTGLWEVSYLGKKGPAVYTRAIERLVNATSPAEISRRNGTIADRVVVFPVEQTYEPKLNERRGQTMTNAAIHGLHKIFESIASRHPAIISGNLAVMNVINKLIDVPFISDYTNDGVHYEDPVTDTQLQILLNLHCNSVVSQQRRSEQTCCTPPKSPNWIQGILIGLGVISASLVIPYYICRGTSAFVRVFGDSRAVLAIATFGWSCVFMYCADRTSLFLKVQKQFDVSQFALASIAVLVVGLVTSKKHDADDRTLTKDQSHEWKGWLQLAILLCNYHQANAVPGLSNLMRALIAAYLFLAGYENFTFYYQEDDYSLSRAAGSLMRLVLLAVTLAFLQDTYYLNYYLPPLLSLWFGIVYVTMFIANAHNKNTSFVLAKILTSATITAAVHMYEAPLNMLFEACNTVFKTQWIASEWQSAVTQDMWIVYVGMIAALAVIKAEEERLWERSWWPTAKLLGLMAAILGLVGYLALAAGLDDCNYDFYHPVISIVAVLSFVVLRNATPLLRSTSSRALSWIGDCSLEMFVCQYHVWLAADSKGLLVLLPWPRLRFLNMVVTTVIFLLVSKQLASATAQIAEWMCDASSQEASAESLPLSGHYVPLRSADESSTSCDDDLDFDPISSSGSDQPFRSTYTPLVRCGALLAIIWSANLAYPR